MKVGLVPFMKLTSIIHLMAILLIAKSATRGYSQAAITFQNPSPPRRKFPLLGNDPDTSTDNHRSRWSWCCGGSFAVPSPQIIKAPSATYEFGRLETLGRAYLQVIVFC